MLKKISLLIIAMLLLGAAVIGPQSAQARQGRDDSSTEVESQVSESPSASAEVEIENEGREAAREIREQARQRREDLKAEARQKKAEAKDEARIARCEQKQEKLKDKYEALRQRTQKVEERIQARLTRAQAFAAKKKLTVPNDDVLLAEIESKRQVVIAAAENIKSAADGFDCANDDAKEQAALIRTEVQAFKAAVKEYRISVKNYFSAVIAAYVASLPSDSVEPSESTSTTPTSTTAPSEGETL